MPSVAPARLSRRIRAAAARALRAAAAAAAARPGAGRLWRAATRIPGLPLAVRLRLAQRLLEAELAAGRVPPGLAGELAGEFGTADRLARRGETRKAAWMLVAALRLAFHRVLHFDRLSSPLAEGPGRFLAPVHASTALRTMTSRRRDRPAAVPAGRPLRLLIATRANANFLSEIRHRYESDPRTETRFLDLAADPGRAPLTGQPEQLVRHLLAGRSAYGDAVAGWLGPPLAWADTVLVDWCLAPAAMFTLLDPGDTRIVVRLHSFELFTMWPHLVNFGRVDDLVLVSGHLRELAKAVVPGLTGGAAPRLVVIPNAVDLHPYQRPKPDRARFTLGLVGLGSVAKDPLWAVEVLRLLRRQDPRYRLLLIGAGPDPAGSPAVARYRDRLEQELAELTRTGAARWAGPTADVPAALTEVGVILSSSVRESFHRALVEGAASGAVPVVRDWPFFAGSGAGARTLFPADWVVGTPEQAAERVLATTASDRAWRDAGGRAAGHALATWDWTVTRQQFDRLLLGAPGPPDRSR